LGGLFAIDVEREAGRAGIAQFGAEPHARDWIVASAKWQRNRNRRSGVAVLR